MHIVIPVLFWICVVLFLFLALLELVKSGLSTCKLLGKKLRKELKMEISPFFVYTIVKLDAFCSFMCSCSVICAVIGVLSYFFGHVTADNYCGTEEERRESRRVGRYLSFKVAPVFLVLSFVTLFVWTVIPTTKQAAVIWLLPKVVTEQNMEKVQSEAGELYDLAKQWLTENAKCNINERDEKTKD